jgi:hypothetical protein
MVFKWLKRLTPSGNTASAIGAGANSPVAVPQATESLRYPPADVGFLVRRPEEILAANQDLLRRLQLHAAVDADVFETRFVAPLRRLAEHINVLPATATELFSGEMGLFRAALELGFYAFQSSDGRIFTGQEGVERRHTLEGRWRYLCFLSGVFYTLGKTLERASVSDAAGTPWKRHFGGLSEWAAQEKVDRIFVAWGSANSESEDIGPTGTSSALIPIVAGRENLQFLEDGAADLVAALYHLSAGQIGTSRIAHQVLVGCWERVLRRELARRPQAFGRLTAGTHMGPYLVGAIRAQVESGRWVINDSFLKADSHGLYMLWPDAAEGIVQYGIANGYPGWPADSATLGELLKAALVVDPGHGDLGMIELVGESGEIVKALKFCNPLAIVQDFDPADYAEGQGKTLESILEADPLAAAERPVDPPVEITAPHDATQLIPVQSETPADGDPSRGQLQEPTDAAEGAADTQPSSANTGTDAGQRGPLREASEVRYSDLLPDDIRQSIPNALHAELLGKVVKAWRDRGDVSDVMRRMDNGAAIATSFLVANMRDFPTWVDAMSKAGLIYAPPQTPGLRVLNVAIREGKPAVQAVVLSNLACRRLGL